MKPIKFKGVNVILGEGQPEYEPLPALGMPHEEGFPMVQCWEITDDDLITIANTRKIWIKQLTGNGQLQPILVTPDKPFELIGDGEETKPD